VSVWKNGPDDRTRKRNQIAERFAWLSIDALQSTAYRVLRFSGISLAAQCRDAHTRLPRIPPCAACGVRRDDQS
jgi:hypothetical protein